MSEPTHMSTTGKEYSFGALLGRSMMPSAISIVAQLCAAILFIVAHFLLLGVSYGAFLPQLLDGGWAAFFTNNITRPVLVAINNQFLGDVIVAIMWGLVGLTLYAIVKAITDGVSNIRTAETDVQVMSNGRYKSHPLIKNTLFTIAWRSAIGAIIAGVTIGLHTPLHRILSTNQSIYDGRQALAPSLKSLAVNIVICVLIMHIYLFLLRLYVLRTRLFGEILY